MFAIYLNFVERDSFFPVVIFSLVSISMSHILLRVPGILAAWVSQGKARINGISIGGGGQEIISSGMGGSIPLAVGGVGDTWPDMSIWII